MDLQTVKSQYGASWAWARTGALILFVVSALLLGMALTASRNVAAAGSPPPASMSISSLLAHTLKG